MLWGVSWALWGLSSIPGPHPSCDNQNIPRHQSPKCPQGDRITPGGKAWTSLMSFQQLFYLRWILPIGRRKQAVGCYLASWGAGPRASQTPSPTL